MINLFVILGAIGLTEILLVAGIVLLLFGGRKIPELMKGLGQGLHEFKKASKDDAAKKDETVKEEIVKEEKK